MKHKITGQQIISPYRFLEVELLPESKQEQEAINNVRNMQASQEEKDIIENYLLFKLNAVSMDWLSGNRVSLKSSIV